MARDALVKPAHNYSMCLPKVAILGPLPCRACLKSTSTPAHFQLVYAHNSLVTVCELKQGTRTQSYSSFDFLQLRRNKPTFPTLTVWKAS